MKFQVSAKDKKTLCKQAPEFREVVRRIELDGFECNGDLFHALVQSIISQQLSIKAADTIYNRVGMAFFYSEEITAENLKSAAVEDLRACGLSARKIEYLRGIADAVLSGRINFDALARLPDEEIMKELVKLKGVGEWTAEMLLIFALGRPDVLSFKDLGIRRGIMLLNKLEELTEEDFEVYRKRYSPYGTLASLYLWRIKDGGLSVK